MWLVLYNIVYIIIVFFVWLGGDYVILIVLDDNGFVCIFFIVLGV